VNNKPTGKKMERTARLKWVPLIQVKVNPLAQRELKPARVDKLATEFDPEQFGSPTVNHRDESYFVIDGQHRIEAFKVWLGEGNWEDQQIQCWTYDGLTEDEEAEVFLKLNDTLAVNAMSKFRVGVQAGRQDECDVDRIVRSQGLRVSTDKSDGAVSAVNTLMRVYRRAEPDTLARTLKVIKFAYGDPGLEAAVIDGLGLFCDRYNGDIEDDRLIKRLSKAMGGVNALLGKAEKLRKDTGSAKAHCVAAAAVEIYNAGRGGRKLHSWWRES
jgi:hypothetical protein